MQREIFTGEHHAFREMVRSFIAREIAPYHEQWERDGQVSRDVWLAAGRAGLLGIDIDEKYGGGGSSDYRYYLILNEELARAGAHGPGFSVHNDINGQYLQRLASPEQRERWLPGTWRRSACTLRTHRSCSSPTCGCPRITCSGTRAAGSSR
jgi:alkylation response protein AidB-like acyl-CoA dehydrogenase